MVNDEHPHPTATVRAIQVRNYRSLRHVDLRLDNDFYVLVGPNGSGKSTLLDAFGFLFDLFRNDLHAAIEARTTNFQDLVWGRPSVEPAFELAAEFDVEGQGFRYEARIEETEQGTRLADERGYLGRLTAEEFDACSDTVFCTEASIKRSSLRPVFRRSAADEVTTFFSDERDDTARMRHPSRQSAIGYLMLVHRVQIATDDRTRDARRFAMPTTDAVATRLTDASVQSVQLDGQRLRAAASPSGGDGKRLAGDGGNLPRVLKVLARSRDQWRAWMAHVRSALPEIQAISIVHREDDRHDYLMVRCANGVEVPSWGVSEGTLRLLALTSIAYLPTDQPVAYLLEEPENGIHPLAMEHVYRSLSSVYNSQVFVASHSPTLLRCVERPDEVLCFAHDSKDGTKIVRGDQHPRLVEWRASIDDELFWAADILT